MIYRKKALLLLITIAYVFVFECVNAQYVVGTQRKMKYYFDLGKVSKYILKTTPSIYQNYLEINKYTYVMNGDTIKIICDNQKCQILVLEKKRKYNYTLSKLKECEISFLGWSKIYENKVYFFKINGKSIYWGLYKDYEIVIKEYHFLKFNDKSSTTSLKNKNKS
jgi:hypothetical protein